MNEFKSHSHSKRRPSTTIDAQASPQEVNDSTETAETVLETHVTDIDSKPTAPELDPTDSSNTAMSIADLKAANSGNVVTRFISAQWQKIKKFYSKYKTQINIVGGLVVVGGIVGATVVGFWMINIWNNESSLAGLGQQPNESSIVFAADGTTELFRFYEEENRTVVELDQISENMQQAIIALEDENFYYNENGIPWTNLAGALVECGVTLGDNCRGASGLSQQLIKNVKNDDEGTVSRKVRELFTAVKLNQETSKEEILSLYLNWVPFGRNAYGVEQAAQVYFGKTAAELDPVESCYLASMVQRPSYFSFGIENPESQAYFDLEARKNACLEKMFSKELVPGQSPLIETEEQLTQLQEQVVVFLPRGVNPEYAHFKDFVTQEINKFVNEQDLLTGGYRIITTIDPATQDAVEASLENRKDQDIFAAGANNAAVVVLDGPSSEIKAMVGSLDYNNTEIDGQVNVALSARQPGSSIKPYVYAASFKQGLHPGSLLLDVETEFEPGYKPKNFSGNFTGVISIRDSLANSYNIPAVKAAYLSAPGDTPNATSGIGAVFDTATDMGVEFPCIPAADGAVCNTEDASNAYRSRCGISASLGGCEINMLSHATGFNTFGQDGKYTEATPFKQIIDGRGNDVYAERQDGNNPVYQKRDDAIDPLIARQINNVLSDYGARYRAFGSSASRLELSGWIGDNAVAAKTGTTNDVKDTWTVGYSPLYTVAVWVGNTDSTPLNQSSTSVGTTSGVWNDVMVHLHADKEKTGFSREGLQAVTIDPTTGLPSEGGSRTEFITASQLEKLNAAQENLNSIPEYKPTENTYFSNGTINVRSKIGINKLDGKLAVEGKTLPENIEETDFNQIVAEYPAWQPTADAFMAKTPELYPIPPSEESDQDQVADQEKEPLIEISLDDDKKDVSEISITATPQGLEGKTISKIEVLINGDSKQVFENQENAVFTDIEDYLSGSHTVLIIVVDSFGGSVEKSYSDVTFDEPPVVELEESDLADLDITCEDYTSGDTETDCTFELTKLQTIPNQFRLRIGNSGNTSCSESVSGNVNTVTCNGVSIPGNSGIFPIQARVTNNNNDYVETKNNYVIVSAQLQNG